jgi:hypothetical protein
VNTVTVLPAFTVLTWAQCPASASATVLTCQYDDESTYNPEDHNMNLHHHENLKYQNIKTYCDQCGSKCRFWQHESSLPWKSHISKPGYTYCHQYGSDTHTYICCHENLKSQNILSSMWQWMQILTTCSFSATKISSLKAYYHRYGNNSNFLFIGELLLQNKDKGKVVPVLN